MKRLVIVLALSMLAVSRAPGAPAPSSPSSSSKEIRRLMEVAGVQEELKQMQMFFAKSMVEGIHRSHPDLPPAALQDVQDGVQEVFASHGEGPDGLQARTEKIMARHFTPEDVDGLIRFFQSPLGRKWVTEKPLVMRDILAEGREWGMSLQPELQARVEQSLRKYGVKNP